MQAVFSVLFWTFFAVSCVVNFVIAVALWIVTAPVDPARRLNHLFSCLWGWIYTVVYPGWDVRVLNRSRIEHGKAYVLVANHTSIADIVVLFTLFRQFKWVSKSTVFRAPFLGWNMFLSRYVPLVRGDPQSIEKMMIVARRWIRRGISIMMFPEGTRSEDGHVKPFKHGAFTLALETRVPVIPIAIHGGHLLIPKHGRAFATRAEITVEVLEPVSPEGHADALAFGEVVRSKIRAALGDAGGDQATPSAPGSLPDGREPAPKPAQRQATAG